MTTSNEKIEWFSEHDNEWQNDMMSEYREEDEDMIDFIERLYEMYHNK